MVTIEVGVVVHRPPEEVWAYLDNPASWPEWNAVIQESTPSEMPLRVGARVRTVARFLARRIESIYEITGYEPGHKVVSKATSPFPLTQTYLVEPTGDGTSVRARLEGEPGGFFKLGESVLAKIAKRQLQAQFDTLKEILEARVPAQTRR